MKELTKNKVLLITSSTENYLPNEDMPTIREKVHEESMYPLGLAYLYSYLESKGIKVSLLNLNNKYYNHCFEIVMREIERFSPDIIGFQILTINRVSSYRLIEYIHKKYPHIQIIIGGIHTTIMYKQLIEKYPFLIAVLGEGEVTSFELIKELNKENPNLEKIDGIAFYKNKKAIRTKPRKLVENLDIFPFPKHELFFKNNKERYLGGIFTSRGCPFNCSFCCLNPESKRIVRFRSPKNVVDEIEHMIKSFPQMTEIFIQDDSFFVDNQRVIDICNEIIRRKIKMTFACEGRMKPISKEMIKKLEEAGFDRICLGVESGDNGILKSCHKGINQKDVLDTLKLFSKSSLNVKIFIMVGLPGETIETIRETARFLKEAQKIKYFSFGTWMSILVVFPGTEVYEIAKAKGMINDDYWLSDKEIPIYTAENSLEQLRRFREILLDNISYQRILTPRGFKAQFEMLPHVTKYMFTRLKKFMKKGTIK